MPHALILQTDVFASEQEFEDVLVAVLERDYGWKNGTLNHPSEQDLLDNWAQILFENNRGIDRLNGQPLTDGEMAQIIEQIVELRTPMRLNGFMADGHDNFLVDRNA